MKIPHITIELQTVNSTNLFAEQLLKTGEVKDGTIIHAHEQTSGKGQGDNSWESGAGLNATFSLILLPDFLHPRNVFELNKTIALGVFDFLNQVVPSNKPSVKWPNDLYIGTLKIGGILIQNTICGMSIDSCIAGIGVNVNQESFNPDLPNPVSLKQITGKDFPIADTINKIVASIDERYLQLKQGLTQVLDNEYQEKLLGFREWRDFIVNKTVIKGKVIGVDKYGRLALEMQDSLVRYFDHGEVAFCLE